MTCITSHTISSNPLVGMADSFFFCTVSNAHGQPFETTVLNYISLALSPAEPQTGVGLRGG